MNASHWRIAPLLTVNGGRAILSLVLTNLLSNALKFTRRCAQADIEIGCQADQKGTTIFVRDNGAGFDMCHADKLFVGHKICLTGGASNLILDCCTVWR